MRLAQTGCWSGTLTVDGETFAVTPDRWWAHAIARGASGRSASRASGHPRPEGQLTGMWNYSPMQFGDHSILYMLNETDDGRRVLEEAIRIWNDGAASPSGSAGPRTTTRSRPGRA